MSREAAFEVGRLFAPLTAIADTLTAAQKDIFVRLPGLAGYYPMSIVSNTGAAAEHSQGGGILIETGTVPLAYDGNAYRHLGNGTNYFSAVGVYSLTGTEAYISASIRGFTIGGWFMVDTLPAAFGGLITKDTANPNRGYSLDISSTGGFVMRTSGNGASVQGAAGPSLATGVWRFVVGRFTPSTEVTLIVDGDKTTNTTAIPASQFVSSANFNVGRGMSDDTRVAHAKSRDVFICRSALSDELIEEVRQSSVP